MKKHHCRSQGFTLIELSIVLVIIGLIIGGILLGQELIGQAGTRAQLAQIEKYNSAVNTFYGKYGGLPGDLNATLAAQFGFIARGQYAGEGDGNGLIEGVSANAASSNNGAYEAAGETSAFWSDLAAAGQVGGSFPNASETNGGGTGWASYAINTAFPAGKIGNGSYVYAFSVSGINMFGVSAITNLAWNGTYGAQALTVAQAYAIDSKIDDGMPQSGNVWAGYLGASGFGDAVDVGAHGLIIFNTLTPYNAPWPASATSCSDAGGTTGTQHYSTEYIGNGVNCGLSFKMQGAAR